VPLYLSVIDIATGRELKRGGVGVRVPAGSRSISFPYRPDRFWSQLSLLLNRYQGLFPGGRLKLTTHLQLVQGKKTRIYTSTSPLYAFMA
jgi:hypothetical protein